MENKDNQEIENKDDHTPEEKQKQRRAFPRGKSRCVIKYRLHDSPDQGFEVSTTKDISAGGIRFTSHKEFKQDTDLYIEILVPPKPTQISVTGKVIWVRKIGTADLYENGIEFTKIESNDQGLIKEFLNYLKGVGRMDSKDEDLGEKAFQEERRTHPRAKARCMVKYKPCNLADEKYEISTTKDISAGGIRFTSGRKFEQGSILSLELLLPLKPAKVTAEGEVIWVTEIKPNVLYENGVKFTKIEITNQNLIAEFVNSLLK